MSDHTVPDLVSHDRRPMFDVETRTVEHVTSTGKVVDVGVPSPVFSSTSGPCMPASEGDRAAFIERCIGLVLDGVHPSALFSFLGVSRAQWTRWMSDGEEASRLSVTDAESLVTWPQVVFEAVDAAAAAVAGALSVVQVKQGLVGELGAVRDALRRFEDGVGSGGSDIGVVGFAISQTRPDALKSFLGLGDGSGE